MTLERLIQVNRSRLMRQTPYSSNWHRIQSNLAAQVQIWRCYNQLRAV